MVTDHHRHSVLLWSLVCMATFFSQSNAQGTGILSGKCSGFAWPYEYSLDFETSVVMQDMPTQIDIFIFDEMCEDPACAAAGFACKPGDCPDCVPITDDYSNTISFVTEKVNGTDSLPVDNNGAICTVGPPLTSNPGHYNGSCVAANRLPGWDNMYALVMSIRDHTNTTVLVQTRKYLMFGVGTPVVRNTWAEFEEVPLGIYHKNMLRLWLRDYMNNTATGNYYRAPFTPFAVKLTITTWGGEPAKLLIPPTLYYRSTEECYVAPVAPLYTGDYVATITVGTVHIANSPLYFTVGKKAGVAVRQPSSSSPLTPGSFLWYLLTALSTAGSLLVA